MHVLILGAGVGGQVAANELRRLLPPDHRITIVDRSLTHAFAPSFLWVMTGERQPERVTRDVRTLVGPGIDVRQGEVRAIDCAARRVEVGGESIAYDYLVVALGAELAPDAIPGLAAAAHTFYTLDGATRLQAALRELGGGTIAVVVCAVPYKCPAAPHEAAMLIADTLRRGGREASVHLFTPEPQPMPVGGPALGDGVRQMLEERGIAFHPGHALTEVKTGAKQLVFEGRAPVGYDLLVAIPPHRPPAVARQAGLANAAGWIPVDRQTLATSDERVFAIGDATAVSIPGRWKPDVPLMLPKAGVFAHAQGLVVARRIAAAAAGAAATATFDGAGFCMLEAGGGRAGMAFGDFFHEPSPDVRAKRVGRLWHAGKVVFERWWLLPWGAGRRALGAAIGACARAVGVRLEM